MPRTLLIVPAVLAVALLAAACGGGGGGAAWCADLDAIVAEGWDAYDRYGRFDDVRHMEIVQQYDDFVWPNADLTDAELDEFAEAFSDANEAGRRHDGRAAVRAWEESLRDAC